MGTTELKSNLIGMIEKINDNSTLQAIYTLLSNADKNNSEDWWNELSSEDQASIEKGLEDYKNGNTFTSDQVKTEMSQKYPQLRF